MNRLTLHIALFAALLTAVACNPGKREDQGEPRKGNNNHDITAPKENLSFKNSVETPPAAVTQFPVNSPTVRATDTTTEYYIPGYHPKREKSHRIIPKLLSRSIPVAENEAGTRDIHAPFSPGPSMEPIAVSDEILLVFGFDNDVWDNTDYYYTNGIKAGLYHPGIRYSPFNRFLLPDFARAVNYYGLFIVHEMFTPVDPDKPDIQYGDRPFASTLYISQRKTSIIPERGIRLSSGLDIGVMGGAALGGFVQRVIHETEPCGWVNQVRNDAVLNYHVRLDKALIRNRYSEAIASGEARLGTLRTGISTGISARAGDFSSQFASISQTSHERGIFSGRLRYFVEAGAEIRLIGYDATLQGGLFNGSNVYTLNSPQIRRLVYLAHAGFGIGLGRVSLEASQVILSPEFSGGKRHLWLGLSSTISL